MENGSKILDLHSFAHCDDSPGPQLLLPREPAYRTFVQNLAYTLLGQPPEHVVITSKPAHSWDHVFLRSGLPWWALLESALWHMVGIVLILAVSKGALRQKIQPQRFAHSSITYYPPSPTFPARGSGRPRTRSSSKATSSTEPAPMRVARQAPNQSHSLVAPPDIAELTKRTPLPQATNPALVAPAMPLSAATPSMVKGLAGTVSVVAPAPDIGRPGSLRQDGMQVTVVAPPPEVQAASSRRGIAGTGVTAVAPTPEIGRGSGAARAGGVDIGRIEVVAPAPQLPTHGSGRGSGIAQIAGAGAGAAIVPPPPSANRSDGLGAGRAGLGFGADSTVAVVRPAPSMQDAAGWTGRGSGGLPGSSGLAAVPPPPSIEGAGSATARGGKGLAGGSGLAVVPPTPSLEGAAGTPGGRRGTGFGGGSGFGAVPPAPSIGGGAGASARRGRGLGGNGSELAAVPPTPALDGSGGSSGRLGGKGFGGGLDVSVVPPAPSIGGTGAGGRGMGMGGGSDLAAVPPAPSLDGTGGSTGRGEMMADSNQQVVPPPPSAEDAGQPPAESGLQTVVEELHMRIVGLALALPSTSFASTYEVFIAERQLASNAVQLIKLVYWFLPYQRRLTDYHPDYSKMYKLRAKRDRACDESLQHMTVSPSGEAFSSAQLATLSPGFPSGNRDVMLPCYRTTADDYRKALSQKR